MKAIREHAIRHVRRLKSSAHRIRRAVSGKIGGAADVSTQAFYWLLGIAASLAFSLALYWMLLIDSSITSLILKTYGASLYFWPYVALTLGTVVLFGVNVALFTYRIRKFGFPRLRLRGQASSGAGTLMGMFASACPACGSTVLSAVGIAGGVAAFPFQGLELKAVSFALMALPVWMMRREVHKLEKDCKNGTCPAPMDHSLKRAERPWLLVLGALAILFSVLIWDKLRDEPVIGAASGGSALVNPDDNALYGVHVTKTGNQLVDDVTAKVLPEEGFQSKVALKDSIVKLADLGVIDREKFAALYANRGGLPGGLADVLDKASDAPILLTRENASHYVNLLWPLGLANYLEGNKKSPIVGEFLFRFASTGGWNLGKEKNGGEYFNKFPIVSLTPEQEAMVIRVAENVYRPCCNNSTFFQDCNHGSALLGLFALGAAQGLTEEDLYREALAFNSFWFPTNYAQLGVYFKAVKGIDWKDVDAKSVLHKDLSSVTGWYTNVNKPLQELGLLPQVKIGSGCGT